MKSFLSPLSKTIGACAITTILAAFALIAADSPAPPPGRPGPGGGGPGGAGGPGNFQGPRGGGGGMMMGGVLDDQQRELYRQASQKNMDELRRLDEKLRAAQKELVKAAIAEKYDEAAVREKAEAVGKIQVQITTLRAKALSAVAPTLKPEQRDQLENSRMGAAMLGGFGGGPGAGFGGPGGGFGGQGGPPQGRRGQGGPNGPPPSDKP